MYATQTDITDLYGPDALYVADRDGDGVADAVSVERELRDGTSLIDSYLRTRYSLPFPDGTDLSILRRLCIDIAVYGLAQSRDVLTDELRRRYDDAIGSLVRLSSGKQSIAVPADPGEEETGASVQSGGPQPVVQGGPERLFSREKTRGL